MKDLKQKNLIAAKHKSQMNIPRIALRLKPKRIEKTLAMISVSNTHKDSNQTQQRKPSTKKAL